MKRSVTGSAGLCAGGGRASDQCRVGPGCCFADESRARYFVIHRLCNIDAVGQEVAVMSLVSAAHVMCASQGTMTRELGTVLWVHAMIRSLFG